MPNRTLLLLIVLALAPVSIAAAFDNCCVCNRNGTNCSACCFPDQEAHCNTIIDGVSPLHCGCYCDPVETGGGGGGGAGCSVTQSRTSVMSVDRGDRGAKMAEHQLQYGLSRQEKRRDGVYLFEEWAVVSAEGALVTASNPKFAARFHEERERFRPRKRSANPNATVLVIEEAEHPANSRQIPTPSVVPITIDADYPAGLSGQEIWFRAEVGTDETVDQVLLLNVPDDLVAGRFATELHLLNGELGKALHLRYADEGRHRAVVFGVLRANLDGHLVMVQSRVLLPKCCCHGSRCA
jgi:hypothetical protein